MHVCDYHDEAIARSYTVDDISKAISARTL